MYLYSHKNSPCVSSLFKQQVNNSLQSVSEDKSSSNNTFNSSSVSAHLDFEIDFIFILLQMTRVSFVHADDQIQC